MFSLQRLQQQYEQHRSSAKISHSRRSAEAGVLLWGCRLNMRCWAAQSIPGQHPLNDHTWVVWGQGR